MLLPIRTSVRPYRTPYTNYALIIVNVIIFLISYWPHNVRIGHNIVQEPLRVWAEGFMLHPSRPYLWQFVSYAFLHGGWLHIIGNMYFLYFFGNSVNDKLGHIGYLCLYFGGSVFAGLGHSMLHVNPVLGASGAVAAVTGAYVVLFPQSVITVLYWFFFIGTMEFLALYFILLKLIFWDNIIEPKLSIDAVAYDAHLAGYAFGIGTAVFLLATGLVATSGFDLWSMIKRWNRRRQYHDVVASGYNPFTGRTKAKPVRVKEIKKTSAQQAQENRIMELRSRIAGCIEQGNLATASQIYLELMQIDQPPTGQVLPKQHLLDIANQLMTDGRHADSARAYEQFLTHYGNYEYVEQVQLMLGILYSRYLEQRSPAIKYLTAASEKLTDPGQKKMCEDELRRLQA
jgi:membrane associated rhomboid family serine protease